MTFTWSSTPRHKGNPLIILIEKYFSSVRGPSIRHVSIQQQHELLRAPELDRSAFPGNALKGGCGEA